MSKVILTESELKLRMAQIYKEEKIKQVKTIWETFTKEEKIFVIEFYKQLHPESKLLSESKWYNWIGDIVGFIPGLELVNVINGVSYWKQGEKLYALLSLLAGLPGMGLILNPIKGLLRLGGSTATLLKGAVATGSVVKLTKVGKMSAPIGKLISSVGSWGAGLIGLLLKLGERIPILKNVIKGLRSIVDLFTQANGRMGGLVTKSVGKTGMSAGNLNKMGSVKPSGVAQPDGFSRTINSLFNN